MVEKKAVVGKCILVAEDDKFCQMALGAIVKAAGATATMTENGEKCVKEFAANSKKYKLILMDISMPVMDGYAATKAIRKVDKKIKIIGLSADDDEDTKAEALKCGMNSLLFKPIKKVELQSIIKDV